MRPNTTKIWKDTAKSKAASESFSIDTAKVWNNAPAEIKNALTLGREKVKLKNSAKNWNYDLNLQISILNTKVVESSRIKI